jgi:hypothetical protein
MARVAYSPWYDQILNEQAQAERAPYVRNADRLRDRDYPSPKPPGRTRVLFLGDSFTFGMGVPDVDSTFVEIIERELNRGRPEGSEIDVLNGGLPGSLPRKWLKLYERIEDSFDPDLVIMVFFLRDGTRLSARGFFFPPLRERVVARNEASWWYRHSFVYRKIRDRHDWGEVSAQYTDLFLQAYFGDEQETRLWRVAQEDMLEIRRRAEERSAGVGFVVFPILADLTDRYPFRSICDEVESFGRENELPTVSLLPVFEGEHAPDLWVSEFNHHPNERAHAMVAESLLPFVRDLLE